jgi:hypothetical protein
MRVWEKSAEAVVVKKAWKQAGAKGRRTKRQAIELTPRNGEQYSETGERCNCGSHSRWRPQGAGGFQFDNGNAGCKPDLGEGEIEGAE